MKDNIAALAQTMSLFDQKGDGDSDNQYNHSEKKMIMKAMQSLDFWR